MRFGLRLQQALYIFLVSLIISAVISIFSSLNQKQNIEHEFLAKGSSLAYLLSDTLVSPLYELQVDKITRLLSHGLKTPDVKRIFVADLDGYILADGTDDNTLSDELVHDVFPEIPADSMMLEGNVLAGENIHLIFSSINAASGEYLGLIVIELSLERANNQIKHSIQKMVSISIAGIILALVLAYIVASKQVKPLLMLKHSAEEIINGNYHIRLNSQRNDELGDLACTIDAMAEHLNTTTVSKDYVNSIIHTMPDGLIVLDKQGNIEQVNLYITTLFEISADALIGESFRHLCYRKIDGVETNISDHHFSGECAIYINDQYYPVNIARKALKVSDNKVETLVVLHDIRKQKTLELERESALEKAKESAKLKSEFLASMSHEIRTPMNGVIGMLRILLNSQLSEQQHHYATLAQSSANSLLALINDILDFSKIDAGKLNIEAVDFDIGSLLGELAEAMAHSAQEKGLELSLDQSGISHTHVVGDSSRFRQILTNLISNAIKFTSEGDIVIQASMKEVDNETLCCTCKVFDTGIGIPQDKINSLFDAFTQADASTTRKYGGTGLGLAIANKLCKKMGNQGIHVKSVVSEGSCFEFSINFVKSAHAIAIEPKVSLVHKKIMLVDNNQHSLDAIGNQLECWGAIVTQVTNGESALRLLQDKTEKNNEAEQLFDLVMINRVMPLMDGCELGKAIRNNHHFDTLPLIMMTSIERHENKEYFQNLGFITSFPKPATLADLSNSTALAFSVTNTKNASQIDQVSEGQQTVDQEGNAVDNLEQTRILLVDDVVMNQIVAANILENFGCITDIAANGIEAIAALNNVPNDLPYEIILMDCQMPEMDGYEATRRIRSGACGLKNNNIPIIAMTANAMKGDKELCLDAGMDDYLTKPIDPDLLKEKLKYWRRPL